MLGHARKGASIAGGRVEIGGRSDARSRHVAAAAQPRRAGQLRAAGPEHGAQPGAAHRAPDHRGARGPRLRRLDGGPPRPHAGGAERGPAAVDAGVPAALPAPAVGRPAAARRAWRWRSPAGRASSCSTSRRPASTSARRPTCSRPSATCASAHGVAALYVTHDLAVVANLADRVAVMYAGRVVEQGPTAELFADAAHPYTRHLIAAVPDMTGDREIVGLPRAGPVAGSPAGRLRVRATLRGGDRRVPGSVSRRSTPVGRRPRRALLPPARARSPTPTRRRARTSAAVTCRRPTPRSRSATCRRPTPGTTVVHDVDLHVAPRRVPRPGRRVRFGQDDGVAVDRRPAPRVDRRDPPRRPRRWPSSARDRAVDAAAEDPVRVPEPVQLAQPAPPGRRLHRPAAGHRQGARRPRPRRASARCSSGCRSRRRTPTATRTSCRAASASGWPSPGRSSSQPDVLVCDEVTSALDVLVQAAIVELLAELQRDLGLSMLFVTHNLPLVRSVAHRVAVMADGRIVEVGSTEQVLTDAGAGVHAAAARRHAADPGRAAVRRRRDGGRDPRRLRHLPGRPGGDHGASTPSAGSRSGGRTGSRHASTTSGCATTAPVRECVHEITKEQTFELVSCPADNPAGRPSPSAATASSTSSGRSTVIAAATTRLAARPPLRRRARRRRRRRRHAVGRVDSRCAADVRRAGRARRRRRPARVARRPARRSA